MSAKAAQYRSKQVRRAIVIEKLWTQTVQKLKRYKIPTLGIKIYGTFFSKKDLLKDLNRAGIQVSVIIIKIPVKHNGSKKKHCRRL